MITFLIALAALIVGYFIYGKIVDNLFGPTDKPTPALVHNDGVDYIPLPTWKVFMIQLLNIAGLGPIFGALGGALWGPSVYLWIVFGTIFAGGVHDYLSGMISLREDGKSISEVVGRHMGSTMLFIMRIFSVVLLVLVGTVFMTGPAGLLAKLTGVAVTIVLPCVLLYYFLATLLPVDTLIARFYPLFGACLIIMALGIMGGMLFGVGGHTMPEMQLANLHPKGDAMPIWPLMFITVACGAVSGFHSLVSSGTSSKAIKNETDMLPVGYGSMLVESLLGVVALVIACAAASDGVLPKGTPFQIFAGSISSFFQMFGLPAAVSTCVITMCVSALAMTTIDSVARIGRMSFQELFTPSEGEKPGAVAALCMNTYFSTIITLMLAFILCLAGYMNIWPLFGAANQLLSALVLISLAVFLRTTGRTGWMLYVPMTFMFIVTMTALVMSVVGIVTKLHAGNFVFMVDGLQLVLALALMTLAVLVVKHCGKELLGGAKEQPQDA